MLAYTQDFSLCYCVVMVLTQVLDCQDVASKKTSLSRQSRQSGGGYAMWGSSATGRLAHAHFRPLDYQSLVGLDRVLGSLSMAS